jgi:hypothetical protein
MFKPKTPIAGRLENSSGEWIRTTDLRVMSPTSCHCSTPHRGFQIYHAHGIASRNLEHARVDYN